MMAPVIATAPGAGRYFLGVRDFKPETYRLFAAGLFRGRDKLLYALPVEPDNLFSIDYDNRNPHLSGKVDHFLRRRPVPGHVFFLVFYP